MMKKILLILSILMLCLYGYSSIYPIQTIPYNTKLVYTIAKGKYSHNDDKVYDRDNKLVYTITKGKYSHNDDKVYEILKEEKENKTEEKRHPFFEFASL